MIRKEDMLVSRLAGLNMPNCYGFADHKGSLRIGKDADFAVLDSLFNCLYTWRQGRCVYNYKTDTDLMNQASYDKWKII